MTEKIPLAQPALVGNEKKYVLDCLESNWISSAGQYVDRFERAFADFCGVSHALSCSNGTVALHLALLALGLQPGDEVIVPTLTFIATANAVTYCGATPIFVDSEPATGNMDPAQLAAALSPRTRGIVVVHLYGHPVDMEPLLEFARTHDLFVVEDAAEAHGARYQGARVGSLGDVATFSFYGNKLITTGEGGMVTTNDPALAQRIWQLKSQGWDGVRRYWFPTVGYNYRMTNVQAAIGLAQLEQIEWHIARRREIADWYHEALSGHPGLRLPVEESWAFNVFWIVTVILDEQLAVARDEVMARMEAAGIETRPVFYPLHTLPPYAPLTAGRRFPVAERLAERGLNLPTWAGLTLEQVQHICDTLRSAIRGP